MKACCGKAARDFLNLRKISGFQGDLEEATGNGHVGVKTLVMYRENVAAALGNDAGDGGELTGTVIQLDLHRCLTSALDKTACDDTRKNGNVNVSSRYNGNDLFAREGKLVKQGSRNANRTRALGDQLLLFDQGKNGGCNFVLTDGDDVVNVFFYNFKRIMGRSPGAKQ